MLYSFPTLLLSLWANIRQHVTWLGKQASQFCTTQTKSYQIKPLPIFTLSFCLLKKASCVSLRAEMLKRRNFHHSSGFFSSETSWSGLFFPQVSPSPGGDTALWTCGVYVVCFGIDKQSSLTLLESINPMQLSRTEQSWWLSWTDVFGRQAGQSTPSLFGVFVSYCCSLLSLTIWSDILINYC